MPNFTEESLQRIIINPFYAFALASQLTEKHEPAMDEAEWVRSARPIDCTATGKKATEQEASSGGGCI